ncbi:MAG: hypothetical protein HY381_02160 [Candidatus Chisholmbacteria bacterium]|nr:hypothetical protein [Candidatus Chisholmbacteria bacterium]
MARLQDFLVSRVRVKTLKVLLSKPGEMYYVRELTRLTGEEINAVRRELGRMTERGMVKTEPRGNRIYYYFRKDYLFYEELLRLAVKTTGLGGEIIKNRAKLGKIKLVMFSGKFVHYQERRQDEVDVLVVGTVVLPELAKLIRAEEANRKSEVNYTAMTGEEFGFRKARRDPFIVSIISQSRVIVIGSEEDLVT